LNPCRQKGCNCNRIPSPAIRALRLCKRGFSSFREYCEKKWGWSKSYAYDIIQSAEVAKSLPEKVSAIADTEGQVRELRKAPPAERAGIVERIVSEGKPVTAKEIRRHLPPPPMVRRETHGKNGRDGGNVPAPPPPSQVLDATGWPIPTHLIPLWQRAGEVQEWLTTLSRLKGVLRSAQENRDMLYAEMHFSSALAQAEQLWTDLKTARPFAVCPTCQGQVPDKCTLCRGRGLISEFRWNTCVTREDKEFRSKARGAAAKRGKQ